MNSTLFKRIKWKNLSLVLLVLGLVIFGTYKAVDFFWTSESEMAQEIPSDAAIYLLESHFVDTSLMNLPMGFLQRFKSDKIALSSFVNVSASSKMFSALYSTSESDYAYTHTIYVGFHWNDEPANLLKNKEAKFTKRNFKNYVIYEVADPAIGFSYVYANGFLILSRNSFLLDNYIIKREKGETMAGSKTIGSLKKQFFQSAVSTLLVNTGQLKTLATNIASESGMKLLNNLGGADSWYLLSVAANKEGGNLVFKGLVESDNAFLKNLQPDAKPTLFSILPENLSYYNYYNSDVQLDKMSFFADIFEKEFLFFNLENRATDYHTYDGFILKTKDISRSLSLLKKYHYDDSSDSILFGNANKTIHRLNFASQVADAFQHGFYKIQNPYYFYINDYIILLNSKEASQLFVDKYLQKKTVNQLPNTSAQFYCNIISSSGIIKDLSRNEDVSSELQDYTSVELNYSKNSGKLDVEIIFSTGKQEQKADDLYSIWQSDIGASKIAYLSTVNKRDASGFYVLAQDDQFALSCLDASGQLLWKKVLDSKVLSNLYSIDYYKNGLEQFVFNTENKIYIVDKNGQFIEDFPLSLGAKATCGMTCFYKAKDPHQAYYYVPCSNGNIYGYEINGLPLAGWNPKKAGQVKSPVQIAYQNGKEFLFYFTDKSALEFYDYKGVSRMSRLNDEASQYHFSVITSDTSSYLFNASKNILKYNLSSNEVEAKAFGPGEGVYAYLAFIPHGEKVPNHAYIKDKELSVLDSKGKQICAYSFKESMHMSIEHCLIDKKDYVLLCNASRTQYYLVNLQGKVLNEHAIASAMPIQVLNNANKTYLITLNGSTVVCSTF